MWDTAATLLLGLLTIAAGANLLAARSTRTLRAIRAEAELLALMDAASTSRAELSRLVEQRVERYVEEARRREEPGMPSVWWIVASAAGTFTLIAVTVVTPDLPLSETPWWWWVLTLGSFALGAVPMVVGTVLTRRWIRSW